MITPDEQRSEKTRETDINKIILLYKKLFETFETEKLEIAEQNLKGIEHCFSLKQDLLSELNALNNGDSSRQGSSGSILSEIPVGSEQQAEIKSLIKKIALINEANAEAVLKLKNRVSDEMSSVNRGKTAFNAYKAYE